MIWGGLATNFHVDLGIFATSSQVYGSMSVIWHAWCLYFGVLGDPGTIHATIGGHKEGPCEVQAWI